MRYMSSEKPSAWKTAEVVLYIIVFLLILSIGIWYQWLDISTKLAIRDMAKQQQTNITNKEN